MEHGQDKTKSAGVNVQDGYFYALRREGKPIHIYLLTGKRISGVLRRFDRYALVVETHGIEVLVYKHSAATVSIVRPEGERLGGESD